MRRIAAFLFAALLCLPAMAQEVYPSRRINLETLNNALRDVVADKAVAQQLEKIETVLFAVEPATPAAHHAKLASQIDLWRPIIEKAGIQGE